MEGGVKKEYIIIAVVVVALLLAVIISKLSVVNIIVGVGKGHKGHDNCLISTYEEFTTFAEETDLESSMEIDLKRKDYTTYYNEDFFKKHKLVAIINHEDTSREFIHSVDDLSYADGKKTANVTYTHREAGYAGSLGNAWYNIMLVEVDPKVEKVNFNSSSNAESK